MRRILYIACWMLSLPAVAHAQPMQEVFERGNEAAFVGEHGDAIEAYEELVRAGVEDPDVEYNLGVSYGAAGELGLSILHFERALSLRPGDEDAERDLTATIEALGRRRADAEGEATVQTNPGFWESNVRGLSADALATALLAFDCLLFALLVAYPFARRESLRLAIAIAAPMAALLAFVILFAGVGVKARWFEDGPPGVVLQDNVMLREGPHAEANPRGTLREGERATLLETRPLFLRVRTTDGRSGWIPLPSFAPLPPPRATPRATQTGTGSRL